MIKLYVSIPIPEVVKKQLKSLDDKIEKCKWTNKNNLHLTVRYIGEVNQTDFLKIRSQLKTISTQSFDLKFSNVGYFPHRKHPTAIWAGVEKNKLLNQLKHLIDDVLVADNLAEVQHKFRPHITLGKLNKGQYQDVSKFLNSNSLFETNQFQVKEFQLVSGHNGGDGIHFEVEHVYRLDQIDKAA